MQQNEETRDLPSPQVRVITDVAEFDRLQVKWAELFSASLQATAALHFDWLRTWWLAYGSEDAGRRLRVITVWRGDRLIGGLPLYAGPARPAAFRLQSLQFLSTGEAEHEETCPDYLDLLCRSGEETACVAAVSQTLTDLSWDTLHLAEMPENSPLAQSLPALLGTADCEVIPRGNCHVANLAGGMTVYFDRLPKDRRQNARRLLRRADRPDVRLEIATERDFPDVFADLVRLHQNRWSRDGKPGCFAAARFTESHRLMYEH